MALQNDLNEIYRWSKYWKLNVNSFKCKGISFTRNRNHIKFVYTINGAPLENVSSFCDLGVTVDSVSHFIDIQSSNKNHSRIHLSSLVSH